MDSLMSFLAEYFYLVVVLLALVGVVMSYRRWLVGLAVAGAFILGVAYLLSKLATQLLSDPRPFIEGGVPALIPSATDNGFPSDHTLLLAAIAATIGLVNWKTGLGFLGLAVVVGLARVYARVHHLLDIAGSLVIVAVALVVYLALKLLAERSFRVSEKYFLLPPLSLPSRIPGSK